jgi:hypothetical protein
MAGQADLQPRRVAVTSVAIRVADEMGCQLGQQVRRIHGLAHNSGWIFDTF